MQMTIKDMITAIVDALEHGATVNTPLVMALHDLEDVDEIVSITGAEFYRAEPNDPTDLGYLELFHDYSHDLKK